MVDYNTTVLHLSLIDGVGDVTIHKIVNQLEVKNHHDLYAYSLLDLMHHFGLLAQSAGRIVAGLQNKQLLEQEIGLIEKHAISWVSSHDSRYPKLLRQQAVPPAIIYWRGDEAAFDEKAIALIGSRKANAYGKQVVCALVPDLVSWGCAIISGGAYGIDSYAHEEAIRAGGRTVAVIGSGLLKPYPREHIKLFDRIAHTGGAVVSSFSLQTEAFPGNFPARNRIISGLSRGCVVVQAAQKSGALITARYALEQGRDVFAVPGPINDPLSYGCHTLIQSGAKLVFKANDIVFEFPDLFPLIERNNRDTVLEKEQMTIEEPVLKSEKKEDFLDLSDAKKKIIWLCKKRAYTTDELLKELDISLAELQIYLFDLQIEGNIEQIGSGLWSTDLK